MFYLIQASLGEWEAPEECDSHVRADHVKIGCILLGSLEPDVPNTGCKVFSILF